MRNNIKRYRLDNAMLQRELGALVGVSNSVIGNWEAGRYDPSPAQQQDIAIALHVPIRAVFPDFKPAPSPSSDKLQRHLEISTMGGLRQSARIKLGEEMVVRLANGNGVNSKDRSESVFTRGRVVQIAPYWFRVQTERGWNICIHYQAFLAENDVRRATT